MGSNTECGQLAKTLIGELRKLGQLTRKQIAALVGVVPLARDRRPAKVALTACMRKLLTILNAIMRSGEPWRVRTTA